MAKQESTELPPEEEDVEAHGFDPPPPPLGPIDRQDEGDVEAHGFDPPPPPLGPID